MSEDLIKRSDAIKATDECFALLARLRVTARQALEAVPSADRPQGEWIDRGMRVPSSWVKKCSLCGYETDTWRWCNYCPNCGARMRPKLQGTHFDSIIIDECAMKGADDEDN